MNNWVYLLRLRVTQNTLQLPFSLFIFLIPSVVFRWTVRILKQVPSVVLIDMGDQNQESFIGHTGKILCLGPKISGVSVWHAIYFRDKQ